MKSPHFAPWFLKSICKSGSFTQLISCPPSKGLYFLIEPYHFLAKFIRMRRWPSSEDGSGPDWKSSKDMVEL